MPEFPLKADSPLYGLAILLLSLPLNGTTVKTRVHDSVQANHDGLLSLSNQHGRKSQRGIVSIWLACGRVCR